MKSFEEVNMLGTKNRPVTSGELKLDLPTPFIPDAGQRPKISFYSPVSTEQPKPALSLKDSRTITVNGKEVRLPEGVMGSVTGSAFKALAGIYQGMLLFIKTGKSSVRVDDDQAVKLVDGQQYEVQPVPRLTRD
jgi:hypothetical protein